MWRKLRSYCRLYGLGVWLAGALCLCGTGTRCVICWGVRPAPGCPARLNGTVEIGALRGSLLSSLVLRDVVLRDRQGIEVAHLDEVRLGYDLTTLLTKRLVVQRVHLVHPQVNAGARP